MPRSVELVAISKYQSVDSIREAANAGQGTFGENYAQELLAKQAQLSDLPISWHFTGHLQANKAKSIVGQCKLIQSVDSMKIAGKIAGIAAEKGIVQDILVEVNLTSETGKTGIEYDYAIDLCECISEINGIRLKGLMGIAPIWSRDIPGAARTNFAKLRRLFEKLPKENRVVLSMGMSGDFIDAIAEGATMVRIGTALFGQRPDLPSKL